MGKILLTTKQACLKFMPRPNPIKPWFNDCWTQYSKTPIYRAPIYRVPLFTGPQFYPPKTSFVCKSV